MGQKEDLLAELNRLKNKGNNIPQSFIDHVSSLSENTIKQTLDILQKRVGG